MHTYSPTSVGRIGKATALHARFVDHPLRMDFESSLCRVRRSYRPFDVLVSLTRASAATYIDADGMIRSAAPDEARFDYSTGRGGLLIEEERTNLIAYSSAFTQGWTLNRDGSGTGQYPAVNIIGSDALQDLPDVSQGSDAGKGFTITGLAYDTAADVFWAGNIALATPGGTQETPQLIKLSADGATALAEISVTHTMQGVAYDEVDDVLYYAAASAQTVYKINKDGSGETALFGSITALNGLACDSMRDQLWLSDGTDLKRYTKAGVLQQTIALGLAADHIWHDAEHDWIWVSYGSSGAPCYIRVVRVADGSTVKIYTFADTYAIEGIVVRGGSIYIANDGYYHSGDISDPARQKNQFQTYPIDYGIIPDALPDYLRIEKGAGTGGVDTSWMQLTLSSNAIRSFACYFKAAHSGDTPRFSIRLDDTTSTLLAHIEPDGNWARYGATKTDGTATQTIKLIARGNAPYSSDNVVRVWAQAADLQNGTFMTSHIPTAGASATRYADTAVISGTAFSEWFNADEGVFVVDFTPLGVPPASVYAGILNLSDGTTNNRMTTILRHTTGLVRTDLVNGGTIINVGDQVLAGGVTGKFVTAYADNNYATLMDGSVPDTDAGPLTVPAADRLQLGNGPGASPNNLVYHAIDYYSVRLGNTRLQQQFS